MTSTLSRRDFLASSARLGTALVVGFHLPGCRRGDLPASVSGAFQPNAWLAVHPGGAVTIWVGRSEMGQGVKTALPMIVAEELSADWQRVRVEQADAGEAYGDQTTVASRSVITGWEPLRQAGAAAREMLISAAADAWGVPREECRAEDGSVMHDATSRTVGYGELVERASRLRVPANPPLKAPADFRLIGRSVPRVDTPAKVDGSAVYGLDVRVPGQVFAAVARCPVFGGRVRHFDPAPALAVAGVMRVLSISSGVAVVADNTWAAFQGKAALDIEWDEGEVARWSTDTMNAAFAAAAARPGEVVASQGDAEASLAAASRRVEATYETPYLAHACMEPMNCTAHVQDGRCEIWAPTQNPDGIRTAAARVLDVPPGAITVHVTYLGGGFGRRGGSTDYATEAVEVAAQLDVPVQVAWTREDDMRGGNYRTTTYSVLRAALDEAGRPLAWHHRMAGPSGPSYMFTRGADALIYPVPNFRLERSRVPVGVPLAEWRGVGPSQNTWIIESMMDELAHLAGRDPYEFRRDLLVDQPRLLAVLDTAARQAGWGSPPPRGRARGIAVTRFGETYIAEVAEVSVARTGPVRVHRVVAAIDCGQVIHPDTVVAQTQGNVVFGLTATLHGAITIDRGRVVQSNFHDYRMLGMAEAPEVEVLLVRSDATPGGVGEAALPCVAPAVCNAIFAATGRRIRRLPINQAG